MRFTSAWGAFAGYTAFGLSVLLAFFGGTFLVGESLTDPGGPLAVPLAIVWCVVTVALAAYALWRPDPAIRVLTVSAALVAVLIVVDLVVRVVPRDRIGPVGTACALAVAAALGCLGLRRPGPAGRLLLLVGVASVGAGGSGVALAGPLLIIAGLFLIAGAGRGRPRLPGGVTARREGSAAAARTRARHRGSA